MWLTKDEHMHPRPLSREHEEGYYIIWNTAEWRKERVSENCESPPFVMVIVD